METIVVGCGVMGLSCGLRLLERDFQVHIVAKELPPHTTSNWAAAIWYPYKAYPEDKVLAWGAAAFDEFQRLKADPQAGVSDVVLMELFDAPTADPWWKTAVTQFRHATPEELPPGYADAYVVVVPVIDTRIYMDYLVERLKALGGTIEQRAVETLDELVAPGRLIVNCAGLGARDLVDDPAVYPIRGQIVRVKADRVQRSYVDEVGPRALSYVVPRTHDVILGGTAQENVWETEPDMKTARDIMRRCREIEPALEGLEVLQHGAGLRPGRPQVRLEAEQLTAACSVIHNYGHGGAGFTLSWGCADEVAAMAETIRAG